MAFRIPLACLVMSMSNLVAGDVRSFIPAKDFALSKRFYAGLGWATREVGPGLALVRVADQQHFYLQDYYVKEVAENSMLHLSVDDAQAWFQHASELLRSDPSFGARVQAPAWQAYGAMVTFLHDPSGVLLHLCQWDARPFERPEP